MREMRYLWRTPVRLDNARLIAVLGHEPHTPLDEAVFATLVGQGVLNASLSGSGRRPDPGIPAFAATNAGVRSNT